jgi:hypothetical protein
MPYSTEPNIDIPAQTPGKFLHHQVDNLSPLVATVFGLATGSTVTIDKEKVKVKAHAQFFAIAGAAGLLTGSVTDCSGRYQLMLSQQFGMQRISRGTKDLLCE